MRVLPSQCDDNISLVRLLWQKKRFMPLHPRSLTHSLQHCPPDFWKGSDFWCLQEWFLRASCFLLTLVLLSSFFRLVCSVMPPVRKSWKRVVESSIAILSTITCVIIAKLPRGVITHFLLRSLIVCELCLFLAQVSSAISYTCRQKNSARLRSLRLVESARLRFLRLADNKITSCRLRSLRLTDLLFNDY